MGWLRKIAGWLGSYPSSPPPIRCLPLYAEMKAKDPELLDAIGHMLVLDGIEAWREKYPEDFTDLNVSIFAVGCVKPK